MKPARYIKGRKFKGEIYPGGERYAGFDYIRHHAFQFMGVFGLFANCSLLLLLSATTVQVDITADCELHVLHVFHPAIHPDLICADSH